jgi:PAS domain S-box-containing protein
MADHLDIRTIIFILGFTHLIQVLVFFHQYKINRAYDGVGWWLAWSAVEAIGFGFMFLRNVAGLQHTFIFLQNMLTVAGTVFLYVGVRKFFHRGINVKILAPVLIIFLIAFSYFLFIREDLRLRSTMLNATLCAISLVTAHSLYVYKIRSIIATAHFLTVIFLVHGGIFLYRAVMIFGGQPIDNFFSPDLFNLIAFFDALIISLLWSFGFIIMLNQRLHSELAEESEKMQMVFNTSPDAAVISRMEDGGIVDVNDGYCQLSGYNREELTGKSSLELHIWKDYSDRSRAVDQLRQQGSVSNLQAVFIANDGREITGLLSARTMNIKGVPHILSITRDISDRIRAEQLLNEKNAEIAAQNEKLMEANEFLRLAKEKAEESDRLKSAFLANMSHEIRTPMNGILGFTELLKEPNLSGADQKKYIEIIERGGIRLLNIINDIISISKIEAGLMEVTLTETSINEQLEYVHAFFKPEAESKGLKLIMETGLPNATALIKTDKEKIYAILTNLVKNAIKFTREGTIEFGYHFLPAGSFQTDDRLEFYIKDSGAGIPVESQDAIFRRFIRAGTADKQSMQGAGLGLAISKAYVEMLGGSIRLNSEIGKGSEFLFTIPYRAASSYSSRSDSAGLADAVRHD